MKYHILGPLQVHADDGRPLRLGPREVRVLAALLLDPGQVVTRNNLVDAVWDEDPPATATRQLQNCVSALRQRLPIVIARSGYRLPVAPEELDAEVFADQVRGGLGQASALAIVMLLMMAPPIALYWLIARRQGLVAT